MADVWFIIKFWCVRDFLHVRSCRESLISLHTHVPAENFQVPSANRMARTSGETANCIMNICKQQSHEIKKQLRVETWRVKNRFELSRASEYYRELL
jgi:hypothetical protein